jgi:hypothetical protein
VIQSRRKVDWDIGFPLGICNKCDSVNTVYAETIGFTDPNVTISRGFEPLNCH